MEAEILKAAAKGVGGSRVKKELPCVTRQGAWTLSNSHREPLSAFRQRSDVDFKRAPSGALRRQIVGGETGGKETSSEEFYCSFCVAHLF